VKIVTVIISIILFEKNSYDIVNLFILFYLLIHLNSNCICCCKFIFYG